MRRKKERGKSCKVAGGGGKWVECEIFDLYAILRHQSNNASIPPPPPLPIHPQKCRHIPVFRGQLGVYIGFPLLLLLDVLVSVVMSALMQGTVFIVAGILVDLVQGILLAGCVVRGIGNGCQPRAILRAFANAGTTREVLKVTDDRGQTSSKLILHPAPVEHEYYQEVSLSWCECFTCSPNVEEAFADLRWDRFEGMGDSQTPTVEQVKQLIAMLRKQKQRRNAGFNKHPKVQVGE